MATAANPIANDEAQLQGTIEMFEAITQSQPQDYQSLEILKEAYQKLGRDKDVANTSKRIAQAYVMMGQLSSAILEYESVLQRCPGDTEAKAALAEIESKAKSLAGGESSSESPDGTRMLTRAEAKAFATGSAGPACAVDDGRTSIYKLFVESKKIISPADFDACWPKPDFSATPQSLAEPFIQLVADKGLHPLDKSLKIIADKHRCAYLPLERYDIDVEMARSMPAAILKRWCVLPFDRMSKSILVATANPFNKHAAKELEEVVQQRLVWYLASPPDLTKALKKVIR
jgi:tetratricopeptide (TPR) repeat protein